ncbi:hypothetical protein ACQKWADRAFT_302669 [Trichoderma austrokoningii]
MVRMGGGHLLCLIMKPHFFLPVLCVCRRVCLVKKNSSYCHSSYSSFCMCVCIFHLNLLFLFKHCYHH